MTHQDDLVARDETSRDRHVREIIDDLIVRRAAGETISDESVIASHPNSMPRLADALRNLRMVECAEQDAKAVSEGLHIRCPHCQNPVELVDEERLSDVICPSCGSNFSLVDDSDRTFQASSQQTIGHFQLLDKVGIGAFGSVWSARDTELDRQVAVKIPRKGQLSVEDGELFIREARAAAQLKHPHIVSVLEVGRHEDRIYIVTDFVQGLDLADWLTDQQATPREAAELCATMADALQHAHDQGVIHRDIKPSNIMLDTDGEPHLMDFGLAKRESGEMTMTVEGKLLGTPAYMSPEQARGAAHDADARSDVYSLGVILFELLTGERPFRGNTRMLLHQVLVEDAPSPRKLNSRVPKDLETICLKCLEKSPDRRYQTSRDLRDDLRRFLRGEPVLARPISQVTRVYRWCRRKPVVAGLGAIVAGLLLFLAIAGPIVGWTQKNLAEKASDARSKAENALVETRQSRESLRRHLYVSDMGMAQRALQHSHTPSVIERLERHRPLADEEDLRGFEWYYLWAACRRSIMSPTFDGAVVDVVFSRDGRTLRSVDRLGHITQRDVKSLRIGKTFSLDEDWPTVAPVLSPDGKTCAYGKSTGEIGLLDVASGQESRLSCDVLDWLTFSPDGRRLACEAQGPIVAAWDARGGILEFTHPVKPTGWGLLALAYSPEGQTLATSEYMGQGVRLWDVTTGTLVKAFDITKHGQVSTAWSVVFSPDGKTLAAGTAGDMIVVLWDVATGQVLHVLRGHDTYVNRLAFSADGAVLASAGRTIRLWDVRTGELVDSLRSNTYESVPFLEFSPNRSVLASPKQGGVKLWQLNDHANPRVRTLPEDWWRAIAISPDGSTVAFGTTAGQIQVWDIESGNTISELSHEAPVFCVDWDDDSGQRLVSVGNDGTLKLWNAETGELLKTFQNESDDLRFIRARLPARDTLLAVRNNLSTSSWDLNVADPDRREIHAAEVPGRRLPSMEIVEWSHDGRWLATSGYESSDKQQEFNVKLWDTSTDKLVQTISDCYAYSMAFSRDDTLLALGCKVGDVVLCDVMSGKEICRLHGHEGPVQSLTFSPDGKRLFAGDQRTVKIWDVQAATLRFELDAHEDSIVLIHLAPNQRTLITVGDDHKIKQWRAASSDEVHVMRERWHASRSPMYE